MVRTRQTARISLAPRRGLAQRANRKTAPASSTRPEDPPPEVVQEYPVSRISDRRERRDGVVVYKLVWHRATGRQPITWETRAFMAEQDFEEHLQAVDRWVEAGHTEPFEEFAARECPAVLTEDPSGTCLFKAMH